MCPRSTERTSIDRIEKKFVYPQDTHQSGSTRDPPFSLFEDVKCLPSDKFEDKPVSRLGPRYKDETHKGCHGPSPEEREKSSVHPLCVSTGVCSEINWK